MNTPIQLTAVNQSAQVALCSGLGKFATDKKNTLQPVTLDEIEALLLFPTEVDKDAAQWVIFSDLMSREHAKQREQGRFYALWGDFDEPEGLTIQQTAEKVVFAIPDRFHVYASRSATKTNQKARVIVPLAEPVSGADFVRLQQIFNDKLEALGLKPDRVTERAGQVCYLPNKGSFYDFKTMEHTRRGFSPSRWCVELEAIKQQEEATKQAAEARKVEAIERSSQRAASGTLSPIQAFNEATDLEHLMQRYGYQKIGSRWLPSESTSGSAGVTVKGDRWISSHDCDRGKGAEGTNGTGGDAFDLFSYYEHGGNRNAALKDAGAMFTTTYGLTLNQTNQRNHMSQQAAYSAPLVDAGGQADRQREYAKEQDRIKAAAEFENFSATTAKPEPKKDQQTEKADVLSPPGIAGDICRLIAARARRDRPELYPLAALHMLALVSSARPTVYTSKLNIITLGIASTAAGKETAQDVIKKLANNCYLSSHIHSDMGSFKEMIINLIDGDGKNLYIMDEVHSTLDSMKSKNAATYETKTEAEILKMTTTGLYTFRGAEKRSIIPNLEKDLATVSSSLSELPDSDISDTFKMLTRTKAKLERQIKHITEGWPDPFVSIMGHSVPEKLDRFASNADNIASGFIGRSLVVRCPEGAEPLRLDLDAREANSLQADISYRLERIKGSTSLITATDEADKYLRGRSAHFEEEEQRNCEYLGAIYRRASEHLFKVAGLLAIESGVINIEHARYAYALVEASIYDIGYLLQQAMAKSEGTSTQAVINAAKLKILKQAKPSSGATITALKKAVTRSTQWQDVQIKYKDGDLFDDLITELIQKEQLEFIDDGRRKRYRTK